MSDVFALPPDTEGAQVTPILFTTQKRCGYFPSPKRPTWRCKNKPLWLVELADHRGAAVCEEHRAALTDGDPR